VELGEAEVALCRQVMDALPGGAVCGRIDLIGDEEGEWRVSEVELVAPMLYFHHGPRACDRLADALVRGLE
jgi:hypothetical protein